MINVVIADDEEKICRLILALGEWDAMGMTVAGTASNGIEAVELIEKTPTDILITDIRMPGIGGIQLIERVRRISPGTRIIIVSGYAEFEYAQSAVHFGVSDYLLKPINRRQLNEALLKLKQQICGEKEQADVLEKTKNRLDTDKNTVRNSLISDIIIDPERKLTEEILKDKYRFNAGKGAYRFLCVKLDDVDSVQAVRLLGENMAGTAQRDFFWNKVIAILNSQLKEMCFDMVIFYQGRYLYGLLNYPEKKDEEIKKAVRRCLNQTGSLRGILRNEQSAFALGVQVKFPDELGQAFQSSRLAIKDRIVRGNGRVLEEESSSGALYDKKHLDQYSKTVTHALEIVDEEEMIAKIRELKLKTEEAHGVRGWEVYELAWQMGSMLLMRLDLPEKNKRLEQYRENCDNCAGFDSLFRVVEDFTGSLINELKRQREDGSARPVRQARKYLMNHYAEPVTLEGISEELGLTPTYFSSLFKKETGMGFARYLSKLRIDAAKELLREGNMPIADICSRVGYNDVRHFNKIFEQDAGVKPAVYRKLYG